ncbi:hypothetical protein Tco_0063282, partial [Tanacetum coccineum]
IRVYDGLELLEEMKGKSQQSVLQWVEDYVERLELLAMRDAARELSESASIK